MPRTPEEIAQLVAIRDRISYNEALACVRDCMSEMELYIESGDIYALEDCVKDYLGLEPDYIDALIM